MKYLKQKNIYLADNFKQWILKDAGNGKPQEVIPNILPKSMNDTKLSCRYGGKFSREDVIATIDGLIKKQTEGQKGTLLNNGYANIFHVELEDGRVVAVNMYWYDVEWFLRARELDCGRAWRGGGAFFSPAKEKAE
jgi:hypothetical protein